MALIVPPHPGPAVGNTSPKVTFSPFEVLCPFGYNAALLRVPDACNVSSACFAVQRRPANQSASVVFRAGSRVHSPRIAISLRFPAIAKLDVVFGRPAVGHQVIIRDLAIEVSTHATDLGL